MMPGGAKKDNINPLRNLSGERRDTALRWGNGFEVAMGKVADKSGVTSRLIFFRAHVNRKYHDCSRLFILVLYLCYICHEKCYSNLSFSLDL